MRTGTTCRDYALDVIAWFAVFFCLAALLMAFGAAAILTIMAARSGDTTSAVLLSITSTITWRAVWRS